MTVKKESPLKPAGRKCPILILLLALLVGACGEEKASPPAPKPPAQSAPSAQAEQAPSAPTPVVAPVANTPPKVDSVRLTPGVVLPGTRLKAEVEASDPDGDLVMLDYEWKRNSQIIAEAVTEELDTTSFAKGDLVTVGITPFDGKEKGESKRSLPVIILNRPPEITSFPPSAATDGKYVYEVVAEDPDGDRLTFSLETAPSGMTIDAESGRVEWNFPTDVTGSFAVRVIVSDGDAHSFQGFSLNLAR